MAGVPMLRIDRSLRRSLRAFGADRLRFLDAAAELGSGRRAAVRAVDGVRRHRSPRWRGNLLVTDSAVVDPPAGDAAPGADGGGREHLHVAGHRHGPSSNRRSRRRSAVERSRAALIGSTRSSRRSSSDVTVGRASRSRAPDGPHRTGRRRLGPARSTAGQRAGAGARGLSATHRRLGRTSTRSALGRHAVRDRVGRFRHARRTGTPSSDYVDGVIDRAPADDDEETLLGRLRSARVAGRPLDRAQVRGHVMGLLLAGNETTAAALSWVLVFGARHLGAWSELRARPERADAFVAETLRLRPPAWGLTRTPTRGGVAMVADGRRVAVRRPGVVTVYLRGMHRDAADWPDPLRFDPHRHRGRRSGTRPAASSPSGSDHAAASGSSSRSPSCGRSRRRSPARATS